MIRPVLPISEFSRRQARIALGLLFLELVAVHLCHSGEVIFVDKSATTTPEKELIERSAVFYGLEVRTFFLEESGKSAEILKALKQRTTRAAVITAEVLALLIPERVLSALHRDYGRSLPLLILGVVPETKSALLQQWSGGAVLDCRVLSSTPIHGYYRVTGSRDIVQQLVGQEIPFAAEAVYNFTLDATHTPETVLSVLNQTDKVPVFVRVSVNRQEVFFQTAMRAISLWDGRSRGQKSVVFSEFAPVLLFLRYSAGEHAWHTLRSYANLTIDDPWLREPYGFLSYTGLLAEMKKADFHTTIAFIPWNYDRNESEVVSLIRQNPDRFSIGVHGNNHDHQEFPSYETRPLSEHVDDIKQAVVRMETFRKLTQLPYDRVMVFPHQIGPAETLATLKKYNFLATVNLVNVALGSQGPTDPLAVLRPVTLAYGNFSSVHRYSAETALSRAEIAVNAFLGNPIFFYAHHDLFEKGIGTFNELARTVNEITPTIHWDSAGHLAQHLYLVRLREDGSYNVKAFSSHVCLDNVHQRKVVFHVTKEDDFAIPIRSVTVDGRPYPYQRSGGQISVTLSLLAGGSRRIVIEYENDLEAKSIDIAQSDLLVLLLRWASDFRDLTLSQYSTGRPLVRFYYKHLSSQANAKSVTVLVLVVLLVSLTLYLRVRGKRERSRSFRKKEI